MAEKTLGEIFQETNSFGLPKIELDVENEMKLGSSAKDVASYLADNSGLDYNLLINDFSDDQIIMGLAQNKGKPYTDPSAFKVFSESFIESAAKGTAGFEGGMMGFKIGMKTPTLPGKILVTPVTTIVSAIAGVEFADNIMELFNFEDNIVPSKMPYKVAGETGGGGVAFMQAPFRAANLVQPGTFAWMQQNAKDLGQKLSTPFLNQVGYTALTRPKTTLALEGSSTIGSAIGGGLAEKGEPGDQVNRLVYEVLFGTAALPALQLLPTIADKGVNFFKGLTPAGRENIRLDEVSTKLKQIIEEKGENVNDILKAINEEELFDFSNFSTAAVTGSEAFKSLNKKLFENYKGFQPELKKQLQDNLLGAEKLMLAMYNTKDPIAISNAAKIRDQLYKTTITLRLAQARIRAEAIINKMTPGVETSEKASLTIQKLVTQALDDVRAEESRLYNLIPGKVTFDVSNTKDTLSKMLSGGRDGLLPGELNELGLKPSGIQFLKRIIGDSAKTDEVTFTNTFLKQTDTLQGSFLQLIGYSPVRIKGVKPNVSNRWSVDKKSIENEFGLQPGSLDNLTINDLKNKNTSALDNAFFSETGDNLTATNKEELLDNLSTKHLKTLRDTVSSLSFRGNTNQRSLAKLIDANIKDFTKTLPEEGLETAIDTSKFSLAELLNLRSQIFSAAKKQASDGDVRNAHFLNKIALSISEDIKIKGDEGTDEVSNLIKQAHGFSLALNDTFTRGFPNTLLKKRKDGRLAVIPELAVGAILKGGGDAVSFNFNALESAVTFLSKQTGREIDEELTKKLGTLSASQEDILNIAFAQIVNQDTKTVDPEKLARFVSSVEYGKVLERFPALKKDLSDLATAQKLYEARKNLYGEVTQGVLSSGNLRAQKKLKNIFTFADILPNDTNPGLVIANAIGTPEQRPGNPLTNLKRIIAFGKKSGNPDVLEGIKEVLVDRAYQYSLNKDGIMDFVAFKNYLTKPLAKGQASVLEVLRNTGVLKGDEALRLNTIVNRMIKAQKSIVDDTTAPPEGELVTGMSTVIDLFTRLIGSKIGTSLSQMIPGRGAGLIEAGAGVRTVLGFLRVPTSITQDFILQAARDPNFAKMLLERPTSEKQALVLARRLRTYLLNSGLGFLTREIDEEEVKGQPPLPRQFDKTFLPTDKQSSVQPNVTGFPTTQITAGPDSGVNNRIAANVGSPPPAAPNINQRTQFASLFPGDITSGLIKANQPTQFMKEGGEVYDLREAPGVDDLRALTLEEYKKFTFEHLLGLQEARDKEIEIYNNPLRFLLSNLNAPYTGDEIGKVKRESAQKIKDLSKQIQEYGMDREIAIQNYPQALAQGAPVSMRRKQDIESGNVQITGFPDYLVKPMRDGGAAYDMGLETDVAAQESIMSGLQGGDEDRSSALETKIPSTITQYDYGADRPSRGIMNINNPLTQSLINSYIGYRVPGTNVTVSPFFDQEKQSITPGFQIQGSFADGGIVGLANGGDPFDMSFSDFAPATNQYSERPMDLTQQDYDDFVTDRAAQIAAPQVNVRRSNIIQSEDYDPQYAQALNITRGRNVFGGIAPGNTAESVRSILGPSRFQERFPQGITSLSVPTDLIPQYGPAPGGGTYYSYGEKILQEPAGLLSFLMPGGFIKPFLETDIGKSIMGSDFVQGVKNFFQPSELKPKVTSNLLTVPTDTGGYSRANLPENITYQNRQITNPVQALAIGIALNENRDLLDERTYKDAQDEYFRRRGRVNQIDVTGLNESI